MSPSDLKFEIDLELEELLVVIGMFIHSGNTLNEVDDEVIYKLYTLMSKEAKGREKFTKIKETLH
tara:strand:- start:45 stop:239 length:195 start_codon:yes stop_codon:yes gene_type:complete